MDAAARQLMEQIFKGDDRGVRIFLFRDHEGLEAADVADGAAHLCERLAFRTAEQQRITVCQDQDRALFELAAPAGQIPAVCNVDLIKVDHRCVQVVFLQNLFDVCQTIVCFLHVVERHGIPPDC